MNRIRIIYRNADAATGGDGGAAVAEATPQAAETASPPAADAKPEGTTDTKPADAAPSHEQDAATVAEMERKFKQQGDRFKADPKEMEAYQRHKAAQAKGEPKGEAPKEDGQAKEPPQAAVPETLKPVLEAVGAKSLEELAPKVQGLTRQLKELNDFKAQGSQALRLYGAQSFKDLADQIHAHQDRLFTDFLAGKPQAKTWAEKHRPDWLKAKPAAPQAAQEGDDDILDTALARRVDSLKADFERRMEEVTTRYENELKEYREAKQSEARAREFEEARKGISTEFRDLIDAHAELRAEGVATKQQVDDIIAYLDSDAYDPAEAVEKAPAPIKPFIEMLEWCREQNSGIAPGSERYFTLSDAFAHLALRGLPERLAQARAAGRKELSRHKPTIGLSDKQGGKTHTQNQSFSDDDLVAIASGQKALPQEWTSEKNGRRVYDKSKVPADILRRMEAMPARRRR